MKTIVGGSIFNGGDRDSKRLSSTLLPVFLTIFLILETITLANRLLKRIEIIKRAKIKSNSIIEIPKSLFE